MLEVWGRARGGSRRARALRPAPPRRRFAWGPTDESGGQPPLPGGKENGHLPQRRRALSDYWYRRDHRHFHPPPAVRDPRCVPGPQTRLDCGLDRVYGPEVAFCVAQRSKRARVGCCVRPAPRPAAAGSWGRCRRVSAGAAIVVLCRDRAGPDRRAAPGSIGEAPACAAATAAAAGPTPRGPRPHPTPRPPAPDTHVRSSGSRQRQQQQRQP